LGPMEDRPGLVVDCKFSEFQEFRFSESGHLETCRERQKPTYSVEKLRIFQNGKFIFDTTNFKLLHTGRDQYLTISSDKATGEPT